MLLTKLFFSKSKLITFIVIIIFSWTVITFQSSKIKNLNKENKNLEIHIQSKNLQLEKLNNLTKQYISSNYKLTKQINSIKENYNKKIIELDNYKNGRLDNVALHKPEIINESINRAITDLMHEFYEATQ